MTYRVVIDTNVVVSSTFWGNVPRLVIERTVREAQPITSDDIVAELLRVLSYPKFEQELTKRKTSALEIAQEFEASCEIVIPVEVPDYVRDPKDRIIFGCAVGGRADYIVSGDKDLTDLKSYEGIPILTPSQFLNLLNSPYTKET